MTYTVLMFGPYAAAVGSSRVTVHLSQTDPCTAGQLLDQLAHQHPTLRDLLPAALLAVNCRRAEPDLPLHTSDELALVGLVSGG